MRAMVVLIALATLPLAGATKLGQTLNTPDVDPPMSLARAALERRDWTQAELLLRSYLGNSQHSAPALYLLASTLFHEDKPKESLAMYTRAAQETPPSAPDLRLVALDYVLLDDYEDADKWITRSARQNANDGETWYVMGRIKYTENRFQEAVDSFLKCLQDEPHSVRAQNNLALAYEGLNQPEMAMRVYRKALAWQIDDPHPSEQPALNLGILLSDRNQLDEALTLLLHAEMLAPHDGKTHGALGKLYVRRKEFQQAEAEFVQAVAAQPNDVGLHFQLGQVYRRLGKKESATAELTRAAALESSQRATAH